MKTDKFEKTIRQKLESISPGFQEDNWAQMQQYMRANTPPTFWQQYGAWLGYAAAASVVTVLTFLYAGQLSKNNQLASDVSQLKSQIDAMAAQTRSITKTDTVYIVQKEVAEQPLYTPANAHIIRYKKEPVNYLAETSKTPSAFDFRPQSGQENAGNIDRPVFNHVPNSGENDFAGIGAKSQSGPVQQPESSESGYNLNGSESNTPHTAISARVLDESFDGIHSLKGTPVMADYNRHMQYKLSSRLTPRKTRQAWLTPSATLAANKNVRDTKKVEKATKSDHIIPQLNIKSPYRFGAGYHLEGNNQAKTIVGEVLVAKKFSISAGLSWLRIKPREFINEKVFRDRNRMDFRRTHPGEVPPMGFEIANIHVKPTLLQIPLTVAFRDDITKDFSYYVGAGTNVTVKGKNNFTFDCRLPVPGKEFLSQSFDTKMDLPLINSVNVTAGIEKTWHPIVVQVEGYLYTYLKALTPENQKTGPGIKVKLLYQIGKKM